MLCAALAQSQVTASKSAELQGHINRGEAAVRTLLDAVHRGGLLLAVYHDLDDEHREHMKSRGVDPADYVGADDLGRLLGDDFTVEMHAVEPRIDPPPGTPHIADVDLRARHR